MTETTAIAWLYFVGLWISYALFHELDRVFRVLIIVSWPLSVPLVLALRWTGLLERLTIWSEMGVATAKERRSQRTKPTPPPRVPAPDGMVPWDLRPPPLDAGYIEVWREEWGGATHVILRNMETNFANRQMNVYGLYWRSITVERPMKRETDF